MTAEEIDQARKKEEANNYITTVKGGVKKIEVLGMEKAYEWRSDVHNIRDVALDKMKISSLGTKDTIKNCIPGCMDPDAMLFTCIKLLIVTPLLAVIV